MLLVSVGETFKLMCSFFLFLIWNLLILFFLLTYAWRCIFLNHTSSPHFVLLFLNGILTPPFGHLFFSGLASFVHYMSEWSQRESLSPLREGSKGREREGEEREERSKKGKREQTTKTNNKQQGTIMSSKDSLSLTQRVRLNHQKPTHTHTHNTSTLFTLADATSSCIVCVLDSFVL